jgi:hypothetical protein
MGQMELDLEREELKLRREDLSPQDLLDEVFLPHLDLKLDQETLQAESLRYGVASEGRFGADWRVRPPWVAAEPILKAYVARELARRSGVEEAVVARYLKRMAEDGWSEEGLDVRAAVKEIWRPGVSLIPAGLSKNALSGLDHALPERSSEVGKALAQAIYEWTQETLLEMGLHKLRLWRGVAFDQPAPAHFTAKGWQARKIEDWLPALSTWTFAKDAAMQYAWWDEGNLVRRILYAEVGIEQVFSTFLSGPGNGSEAEVLLLGGKLALRATSAKEEA